MPSTDRLSEPAPLVRAVALTCRYGARMAVCEASFVAAAGTITALLGPNGAGKSTLLRALAGLVPREGEVWLEGVPLSSLSRRAIAQRVALVAQDPPADVPFSVRELALMGRAPHLGRLALEGAEDVRLAEQAMREADVLALADRPIDTLSGGEKRRAFLARALTQRPRLLLLDEPTAFLDLGHQAQVMDRVRAFADAGLGVVIVLHDPNLAATWSDRALLMQDGALVAQGPSREVLASERLEALYGARLVEARGPGGEGPFFAPFRARR
jgi:iron complex transport system ATP-binding protein